MQLRNHPLMGYGSIRNWPPVWISLHPKGKEQWKEVGVLTEVRKSQFRADRLVLVMECDEDLYGAALTFSDAAFCNSIFELLKNSVGLTIAEVGNMSLNSYVTPDGKEIGCAQATQAAACGIEASADMNPILLKPVLGLGSQVIVQGKLDRNMGTENYYSLKQP